MSFPGDQLLLHSPGGGGYGSLEERAEDAINDDLIDGFVSKEG